MKKIGKNRLKKEHFFKRIAINQDVSELKNIDLFMMLNESLKNDIFIVDTRNRADHVDENHVLKNEYIKQISYDNSENQLFNTTKDNKMYLNINISIHHYTKIRGVDWLKYMSHLSYNSSHTDF